MEPIKTGRAGCEFGCVDIAVDPEGRFVLVNAGGLAGNDYEPDWAAFMASAQFT